MKRSWILPLCAALASGTLAFTAARRMACPDRADPLLSLRDISFLARELNLNAEQQQGIKVLNAGLVRELDDCCVRYCAARTRLGQALAGGSLTEAHADALLDEMCKAYAGSERATLAHIRRVHDLLDSEQRRRFDKLLIDALLCKDCPQACR